jgi:hypothetical protein
VELMETRRCRKSQKFFDFLVASILRSGINGNKKQVQIMVSSILKVASILRSGINGNVKPFLFNG